jgi:hypothetical protein
MPGGAALPGFFLPDRRQKKANLAAGSEYETCLFRVVRVIVFAAIAFSAVTIQVQAVVRQADTVTCGDFTLARFNGIIAEFNDLAAIQADQVIVVMLLSQFEYRFTAFEIMTGDNARVIKLVQHTIDGCQPNLFAHVDKTLIKVFRTDMVIVWTLKHFKDF